MDENGWTTVEELQGCQFKTETVNGRKYQIRKIGPGEYIALGGSADLGYFGEIKARQEAGEEVKLPAHREQEALEFADRVLVAGLRSVRLVMGKAVPGDGQLHVRDFPDGDKSPLLLLILKLAGVTPEEAAKVGPTSGTQEAS